MENKSKLVTDLTAKKSSKFKNPAEEKAAELNLEIKKAVKAEPEVPSGNAISADKLREAVIWSEILGKPVSRRRNRRSGERQTDRGMAGRI